VPEDWSGASQRFVEVPKYADENRLAVTREVREQARLLRKPAPSGGERLIVLSTTSDLGTRLRQERPRQVQQPSHQHFQASACDAFTGNGEACPKHRAGRAADEKGGGEEAWEAQGSKRRLVLEATKVKVTTSAGETAAGRGVVGEPGGEGTDWSELPELE
jgi:hypothetical protein